MNLLGEGGALPSGQILEYNLAEMCWQEVMRVADYNQRKRQCQQFNRLVIIIVLRPWGYGKLAVGILK